MNHESKENFWNSETNPIKIILKKSEWKELFAIIGKIMESG